MTKDEFAEQYPNIYGTLMILAHADGTETKMYEEMTIPPFLMPSLNIFENQASQLSDEEKELLALGEDEDRADLIRRTGFVAFDDFITEAYEGMLSDIFFPLA